MRTSDPLRPVVPNKSRHSETKPTNENSDPKAAVNVSKKSYLCALRLATLTKPNKPDPSNQAAAGTGTAAINT